MLQAGSLSGNLPKWREVTNDPWILQTVSGYQLEFETTPLQVNLSRFPKFTKRETALIESEIKKLISKGALTEVSPFDDEFISTVFLVPKKTGDFRPVINLVFPMGTSWSLLTFRMLLSVYLFSSLVVNTYFFFGISSVMSLIAYLLGTALHPGFYGLF